MTKRTDTPIVFTCMTHPNTVYLHDQEDRHPNTVYLHGQQM